MENSSRTKYFIKNTFIFALSNIATKAISFFLVPIYTTVLSTYDYGVIDLATTLITVIIPIVTLNICESVMRFALDKGTDPNKIIQIGTKVYLTGCVVSIFVIPICGFFENLASYGHLIYFYMIFTAGSQLYLCDLRGKELLLQYSIGNILQTVLVAMLNIVFLLFFRWGLAGYFGAYTIASFVTMIYALVIGKGYRAFSLRRMDTSLFKKMAKYSLVLIPNNFMWWIMNSSDRIMVSAMVGVSANGIYAISYKLPSIVTLAASVVVQAWSYSAIKEKDSEDEAEFNNKMLLFLICISMVTGITLCTFMKQILHIYVSADYYEAWKYTPFLIIGCVYLTLASFIATSYTVHKDSSGFLFSSLLGALFNIVLNYILIPHFQVFGAAIATCISYIVVFVFRLFHTRKYLRYNIINSQFIFGSCMLILVAFLMFVDGRFGQILQIVVLIISLSFYLIIEKRSIFKLCSSLFNCIKNK